MNILLPSLMLIIAGIAAISNFIIAKKPEAKEQLDKLKPINGWVGVLLLLVGLYYFFGLSDLPWYFKWFKLFKPFSFLPKITLLLFPLISIVLGFMQGYSLIDQYVLNKAKGQGSAGEKFDKLGDSAYEKIVKYTTPVGFIGIGVGLMLLLMDLEIISLM